MPPRKCYPVTVTTTAATLPARYASMAATLPARYASMVSEPGSLHLATTFLEVISFHGDLLSDLAIGAGGGLINGVPATATILELKPIRKAQLMTSMTVISSRSINSTS